MQKFQTYRILDKLLNQIFITKTYINNYYEIRNFINFNQRSC